MKGIFLGYKTIDDINNTWASETFSFLQKIGG